MFAMINSPSFLSVRSRKKASALNHDGARAAADVSQVAVALDKRIARGFEGVANLDRSRHSVVSTHEKKLDGNAQLPLPARSVLLKRRLRWCRGGRRTSRTAREVW